MSAAKYKADRARLVWSTRDMIRHKMRIKTRNLPASV